MSFSEQHLRESIEITNAIDPDVIEKIVEILVDVKATGGRLFVLGVGGSAANAGHAVNDFRKLASIETYAPTDNVAELTARTNDEGWQTVFSGWLKVSKITSKDCLFILSVGGGNKEKNVSPNLIEAIDLAKEVGARVTGIVGRDGGYTAQNADVCLVVPTVTKILQFYELGYFITKNCLETSCQICPHASLPK